MRTLKTSLFLAAIAWGALSPSIAFAQDEEYSEEYSEEASQESSEETPTEYSEAVEASSEEYFQGASATRTPASADSLHPSLQTLVQSINDYRQDSGAHVRNFNYQLDVTLLETPDNVRGEVVLPLTEELNASAQATAERFARGEYDYNAKNPHHQMDNGVLNGPTVRAIKSGWTPAWNTLYKAETTPPHTGIRENLFQGPANLDPSEVLKGWQKSPGHNLALLKAQAHAMGVGYAQNETTSYWVFLVESEAHMDESPNNMRLFGFNTLISFKPGANPSMAASEAFEWVDGGLDSIRNQ
jgi:hypothetical protein